MTGDNNTYLRLWHEVNIGKIGFELYSHAEMIDSSMKWFPVTSGGEKRRWYGNFDTIVNLENDGADIKANVKNYRLRDSQYYMLEAITWTEIFQAFLPVGMFQKEFCLEMVDQLVFL